MSHEVRNRAAAELVRRTGSLEGLQHVLGERIALSEPLGALLDWEPAFTAPRSDKPGYTQLWEVKTFSGSVYRIHQRGDGTFWLEGENVATSQSRDIRGNFLQIGRPVRWPPELGQPLVMTIIEFAKTRISSDVVAVQGPTLLAEA